MKTFSSFSGIIFAITTFCSLPALAEEPVGVPAAKSFGGINFGAGIGLTLDVQKSNRVSSAAAVNNVVRVTETNDAIASLVLESHYFIIPPGSSGNWGHGPFVAIEAGSGNLINAYGIGWMIGFRQPSYTYNDTDMRWKRTYSSSSWNFGVGLRVDPKAQVLGDGLVANQPLPAGDSIRFKTEPRYGVMLVSSFSF